MILTCVRGPTSTDCTVHTRLTAWTETVVMARILAMTTTSLADAKNRLSEIIQSAQETHERFVITKNGRPAVVLISVDDLESLEETLDILSDPQLMVEVRESQAEAARGDFATEAELRADLAARRARR